MEVTLEEMNTIYIYANIWRQVYMKSVWLIALLSYTEECGKVYFFLRKALNLYILATDSWYNF